MPTYKAPLDDVRFLLHEVLDVAQISQLPGFEDATPDVIDAVLAEGAKLCEEVLAPLNQVGDAEGVTLENGQVRTPTGFRDAYDQFVAGGWTGMSAPSEFGGQGLPHFSRFVLDEFLCAANLSLAMYPSLGHGATNALYTHGSDELKQRYLPKLIDGSWAGTMCLTEAHAGTDLGILTTRAVPAGDGAHLVTGSKIFISAGEHDLTENIVHLVLARLPDAPAGTKGISMFVVPKFLPTDEGTPGTANGVTCGSIEHKMGIKGSATCVINFDGSRGWLVGEPHKGMRAMFTMMNGARLGVGIQGLGLGDVSYQNAVAYARDRVQGRSLTGPKQPGSVADPIIVHPDVRRMLLTMKAYTEGNRALAAWVGMQLDVAERHPDEARRQEAEDLLSLMTPVVKAFFTDVGFEVTNLGLQTLGGHGYVREYGMEQFVRDARIGQIYEGTNGVQALDLVGRKLPEGGGRLVKRFFAMVGAELAAAKSDERLAEFAGPLSDAVARLQQATVTIATRGMQNPDEAGAASADYLRMFGLVAVGHMWLQMARVALAKQQGGGAMDATFYDTKVKTARFYFTKLLPQVHALSATIAAGSAPVMELDAAAF
jgi:alkylation response protein AidB-like acyl-CoA dehydrogenase